ncbi:hypothetical protein BC835DRAFT_1462113 [Cytidiella melzeri]|nr:hypothetical protein BC835DRAFT_1462113 [Cytidiella melzeri]
MYNNPTCKPWTSSKWSPEGFIGRDDMIAQDRAGAADSKTAGGDDARIEKVGLNCMEEAEYSTRTEQVETL